MADSLDRYRAKRDFKATPEPRAEAVHSGEALRFVVQEHHARRLHYDLRLELDGVLMSWAVPKGPSLVVGERRMAVRTEDHPLAYADFEGTIPPGQYGAGTMTIWDRGLWMPGGDPHDGLRRGKLKVLLYGERLRGVWNLVRTRGRAGASGGAGSAGAGEDGKDWLLIREDAPMPDEG
jgi:bifunctional non-homologous end joining protein LigD